MSLDVSPYDDVVTAPPYFRGEWIAPSAHAYDERRAHFNHLFDRRPAVVARCVGVEDVRTALRVAHEKGWEIAVRGGGRGPGGHSAIDGGMLLDLSLMNDVFVDADRRTARVGPGATQSDVLRETVPYGLAPITGLLSHIGFVGVAIYSGTGHLSPRHGYSCDWVLSAQVVLADGDVVTVSPTSHPDLFWAIRGAGDNFGVVVSVETQLHAVPKTTTLATWSWPATDVTQLLDRYRAFERTVSTDVFVVAGYSAGPGRQPTFDVVLAHLGDDEAVARDVAHIDAFGTPVDRSVTEMGWLDLHHALDEAYPSCRQYWAAADLKTLDDTTLALLANEPHRLADAPAGAELFVGFYSYRGAMLRQVSSPPAAMSRRHGCELIAIAMYDDPTDDAACEAWGDGLVARYRDAGLVHPGAMPNYTTHVDMRESWGADYDRLAALKATYDPQNVFRRNCNIPPATWPTPRARRTEGMSMNHVHDIEAIFEDLLTALRRGDVEAAVQHFAEDGVVVDHTAPDQPVVGRAAIAEVLNGYRRLMPDMTLEVTGILTGADRLSGELVIQGTPVGQDTPVVLRYGVFEQFRDGKIIAEHLYSDSRQLPVGL